MNITDQSTADTIRDFLSLPSEAMPAAAFVDDTDCGVSAWTHLRDWLLPEHRQRINHMGERVHLVADHDGWRDGVTVTLA